MYYELYIDVFFLVNFVMDYLLLLFIRKTLKCTATHGRVCLGAAVGAFLTCLIVILPISSIVMKFILFHVFVNTCMIRAGLKIKTIRSFVKSLLMLYIGGFLLGGILEAFRQYVRVGSLFFAVAIAGYYMVLWIWKFISYLQRYSSYHCEVELYLGDRMYRVKGMIDTGNGLSDPISGRPVNILERKIVKKLFIN